MILDCHTHTPRPGAIVNADPSEIASLPDTPGIVYSVGIHPWNASKATPEALARLRHMAADPRAVAIGETGIDLLHPLPDRQAELFRLHVELSEELRKPVVIHCVRAFDRILAIRKQTRPAMPWIIHGFRGNERLARQLLDSGLYLSYGERFNPRAVAVTPPDRLLAETDTSPLPIQEIISRLGRPDLRQFVISNL